MGHTGTELVARDVDSGWTVDSEKMGRVDSLRDLSQSDDVGEGVNNNGERRGQCERWGEEKDGGGGEMDL
jgi:hypothetical protein